LFIAYIVTNMLGGSASRSPAVHGAMLALAFMMTLNVIYITRGIAGTRAVPDDSKLTTGSASIIRRLAAAIDVSDPARRGRGYRVAHFSKKIAERLGMTGRELGELECAAWLHDIGRTALHYEVMVKPGELNDVERELVRSHPQIGYEILRDLPGLKRAAEIVRAHHEQPNGAGYPRGLMEADIPVGSRIILTVLAFDSLTSDRPYREGMAPEVAYRELRAHCGSMFFTDVVETLIELHASHEIFDGFSPQELEMYSRGYYTSRAVQSYLESKGLMQPAPVVEPEEFVAGDEIEVPADFFGSSTETHALHEGEAASSA
jgi:HD-GYP domain-containing protein (c-di-GMP phosphodiesterase class II)